MRGPKCCLCLWVSCRYKLSKSWRFERRKWQVCLYKPANSSESKALYIEARELVRDRLANPVASKYLMEDAGADGLGAFARWLIAIAASSLSQVSLSC